jgi:tetraacyldisaccharide 4'-kinase
MKNGGEVCPDAFNNTAFLVSAIGNPDRFSRDIQQCGIRIRGTRFFRDHHQLTLNDWTNCIKSAKSVNAEVIIMTEKDAVKVSEIPDFPIMVAVQSTEMSDGSEFERLIEKRVKELQCATLI